MNPDSHTLLARLAGSGNPGVGSVAPLGAASRVRAAGADQVSFEELLRKAEAGELRSGLPVSVDPSSGVSLSEDQLARVSEAADRAEAAGLRTAMVELDGRWLLLDVSSRTVKGSVDPSAGPIRGIDGVVRASAPVAATVPVGPGAAAVPASAGAAGVSTSSLPSPDNPGVLAMLADQRTKRSA